MVVPCCETFPVCREMYTAEHAIWHRLLDAIMIFNEDGLLTSRASRCVPNWCQTSNCCVPSSDRVLWLCRDRLESHSGGSIFGGGWVVYWWEGVSWLIWTARTWCWGKPWSRAKRIRGWRGWVRVLGAILLFLGKERAVVVRGRGKIEKGGQEEEFTVVRWGWMWVCVGRMLTWPIHPYSTIIPCQPTTIPITTLLAILILISNILFAGGSRSRNLSSRSQLSILRHLMLWWLMERLHSLSLSRLRSLTHISWVGGLAGDPQGV